MSSSYPVPAWLGTWVCSMPYAKASICLLNSSFEWSICSWSVATFWPLWKNNIRGGFDRCKPLEIINSPCNSFWIRIVLCYQLMKVSYKCKSNVKVKWLGWRQKDYKHLISLPKREREKTKLCNNCVQSIILSETVSLHFGITIHK